MISITKITATFSSLLSLFEVLGKLWNFGKKLMRGFSSEGIYEVLEWENNLELHDPAGKNASFSKREKIRILQDNIIAYQDVAWGDGKILIDYQCSPGKVVDRYRLGYKTFIVISLRKVRNRGEVEEFDISWKHRNGFLRKSEQWETKIRHRVKKLKITITFPKERPPVQWRVIESTTQKRLDMKKESRRKLSDGRWRITWIKEAPRLYENYVFDWEW